MRAGKDAMLSVKLDVIKHFDGDGQNKDIARASDLPVSTIHAIYMQRERILKALEVTVVSASSKVVSFSQLPVMYKVESLLLQWIDGLMKCGVYLSYYT